MALISLLAPSPKHPDQARFVEWSEKRRTIVRAGRRGGKTTGVAAMACLRFAKDRKVLYISPTSDQLKTFWTKVKYQLAELLPFAYVNETQHTIQLGRAEIVGRSGWKPDHLRSGTADDIILDEWQLQAEEVWEEVCAPMLMDTNGTATFIYTPISWRTLHKSHSKDPRHAAKLRLRALADPERWRVIEFSSLVNPFLNKRGIAEVTKDLTDTAYRQEILAEDIDEVPGALWTRESIESHRLSSLDGVDLRRVVLGVDPSSGTGEGDACGIVASGLARIKNQMAGIVIKDYTMNGPPEAWGRRVAEAIKDCDADTVIAESNQGGQMVKTVLRSCGVEVPIVMVHASKGKAARAEPISVKPIYWLGGQRVAKVEHEACTWIPGMASPNALDAMVWGMTKLLLSGSRLQDLTAAYSDQSDQVEQAA